MEHEIEKILKGYLQEIEDELKAVPRASRAEFIAEIHSHLLEEWNSRSSPTEQDLLQIIHNFGAPREIAGGYLEKFPDTDQGRVRISYPPTWLVLVLTVLIWPVGIVLAWLSPAWRVRDKVIATLIPVFVFLFLVFFSLAAYTRFEVQQTGQTKHVQEKSVILEIPEQHGKLERLPEDRR